MPLQRSTISCMPTFAKIVRNTIALLMFPVVGLDK
jgi:hypothetical protein